MDRENWEGVSPLGKVIFWIFYSVTVTALLLATGYLWYTGMNGLH